MANITKDPLISIIVPIYKVEPYLRKCLDSIVNQTYQNLEVILVDDGSPDRCGDICDEYAIRDQRIIVIHQENQGVSVARNKGLEIAKGQYIQFADSDDWLEPDACKTALNAAIEKHADLVYFGYTVVYASGETRAVVADAPKEQEKATIMHELIWQRGCFCDASWNKLFARALFDDIRFPVGKLYEDMDVSYKLLHNAHSIHMINASLYFYVQRQGSITSNDYHGRAYSDRMSTYKERLRFLQKYYPESYDLQLSMMLRDMLIGRGKLKGTPSYYRVQNDLKEFVAQNKDKLKSMAQYTRISWIYYYCRPLLPLFLKLRG